MKTGLAALWVQRVLSNINTNKFYELVLRIKEQNENLPTW